MKLFGRKSEAVHRPAPGDIIPLDQVPDPVFAGGVLGPGFAVLPTAGQIVSPVDGEVISVAETNHAFGIRTAAGAEFLVHVGVDTVTLSGTGFQPHVAPGDRVRIGDALVTVDLAAVVGKVPSMATPVILLNSTLFTLGDVDVTGTPVTTVKPS